MGRGAWWATVLGSKRVGKTGTRLKRLTLTTLAPNTCPDLMRYVMNI